MRVYEQLDKEQIRAIVKRITVDKVPSRSIFDSLGAFSAHLPHEFFDGLPAAEVRFEAVSKLLSKYW